MNRKISLDFNLLKNNHLLMIKVFTMLLLASPDSGLSVLFVPICHDSNKMEEMGQ